MQEGLGVKSKETGLYVSPAVHCTHDTDRLYTALKSRLGKFRQAGLVMAIGCSGAFRSVLAALNVDGMTLNVSARGIGQRCSRAFHRMELSVVLCGNNGLQRGNGNPPEIGAQREYALAFPTYSD